MANLKAGRLPGDFWRLLAALTVSLLGSQVSLVAMPLIALSLQASPRQLGLLVAAGYAPYLFFGLLVGAWVDRLRRRPLMIAADLGRAALIGSIPLAALRGSLGLPQLALVAFATGTLTLCFDVAQDAYVPALLRREQLISGNSRLATATTAAETAGPGLGALAVQLLGGPLALALDAGSFLLSALCLGTIRRHEGRAARGGGRVTIWREAGAGLRLVWRTPVLRAMTASGAILQFTGGIFDALQALFIVRTLGLPPFVFGLLFMVGSGAGLLATSLAASAIRRLGPGPAILGAALAISAGWLTMPLAFGGSGLLVAVLVAGAVVRGAGNAIYNISVTSARQAVTPGAMLGRANSAALFVAWGMLPLGALAGGGLGAALGVREAMLLGSVARIALLLWCCAAPLLAFRALEPVAAP